MRFIGVNEIGPIRNWFRKNGLSAHMTLAAPSHDNYHTA